MLWGPGETSTQGSGRMCQESKVTVAQSHVTSTSHTTELLPLPLHPPHPGRCFWWGGGTHTCSRAW